MLHIADVSTQEGVLFWLACCNRLVLAAASAAARSSAAFAAAVDLLKSATIKKYEATAAIV